MDFPTKQRNCMSNYQLRMEMAMYMHYYFKLALYCKWDQNYGRDGRVFGHITEGRFDERSDI